MDRMRQDLDDIADSSFFRPDWVWLWNAGWAPLAQRALATGLWPRMNRRGSSVIPGRIGLGAGEGVFDA
jgi:hypothetical protein